MVLFKMRGLIAEAVVFYAFQFPIPPHHHSITLIVEYLGSFPSCSCLIAFDNAVDSDSQSCMNFGVLQKMKIARWSPEVHSSLVFAMLACCP